jgi:2-succinyl-5-enolpyruvyl-6-hydroxy-3-cyclohexene-1-carboxylate synthase
MQPNQHIAELGPLLGILGLRHVVIAPGSRNAPLIQLFTSSASFICHSIVDERSAAYVALGMARLLGEPVAVVTTSGTAVLNLGPAIAEAYYQHLPLVILTADRPVEPIRQFNNQVIDQLAPFYNHTKGYYELPPEPRERQEVDEALTAVEELVRESMAYPAGPVHINVPLLEPLYEPLPPAMKSASSFHPKAVDAEGERSGRVPPSVVMVPDQKLLVLAGMESYDPRVRKALETLVARLSCVVISENITNLHSDRFIGNPELILAGATDPETSALAPDLVIALGGQVVSKRLKNLLQSGDDLKTLFPEEDPSRFLTDLAENLEAKPPGALNRYLEDWKSLEKRQLEKSQSAIEKADFCNLTAVSEILRKVPGDWVVHLGNSATIRNSQLVPVRADLTYFSNRGTSGIDGSLSTAVGAAMVSEKQHLLLVGDLSFVYDSNGLWNHNFPENLRIFVLNDGGGGIFRLLEGPDRMDFFETFSVTHHPVSIELLAQAYGRVFQRVSDMEGLRGVLQLLHQPGNVPAVVEVDTTGSENSRIFKSFIQQIR